MKKSLGIATVARSLFSLALLPLVGLTACDRSIAPDGNVYLADTESHSIRMIDVRRRTLELIAGTGEGGDGPDGDPLKCKMARPHGVFVDKDGRIFIGDSETHRVRVIE